jgi:hypothetical protein
MKYCSRCLNVEQAKIQVSMMRMCLNCTPAVMIL